MESLAERRERYVLRLEHALERILAALRSMQAVERVILIGSYAQGRRDLLTDLDLVVVMQSDQDFVTRTAKLYSEIQSDVDLDLLAYTPREFAVMAQQGFLRHALEKGRVLYQKKST